ncbi:nitroreductase family protein [Thalassotalea sp. PP2-459]|uniref:nitroreductase family protein n=1 Tax=Thalassotalea sp. PP2-459 TaxID=1742724 RepID=UPI00094359B0|nr:nitroreductase family protein [Thalassotalea sp. PP2-459]OKY25024.1 hypothetical protein BI291_17420 [Thalassotalea sp. PP2-459]
MSILSALNWRYAVRNFTDEKLNKKIIQELIEATRLSPSAYGLQPYRLVIVESRDVRNDLVSHSMGQEKVRDCSHLFVLATKSKIDTEFIVNHFKMAERQRNLTASSLSGYTDVVKGIMLSLSETQIQHWAENQVYFALRNLLTAAALNEVDACPMAGFDKQGFDDVLNLEQYHLKSTVICALGKRDTSDSTALMNKVRIPSKEFSLVL